MDNIPEIIEAVDGLNEALSAAASDKEAAAAIEDWKIKNPEAYGKFDKMPGGNPFENIESVERPRGGGRGVDITTKPPNSIKFNTHDVNTDFQGDTGGGKGGTEAPKPPNLENGFRSMGMTDDDVFKSKNFQEVNKTQVDAFKNKPGTQANENVVNSETAGRKVPDPKSPEEMAEQSNKTKLSEKVEKKVKSGGKVGRWIKYTLEVGAMAWTYEQLYTAIKQHQNSMNGCWLIDNNSNDKCKLKLLTCNKADITSATGFTLCDYCTDGTNCGNLKFNPCIAGFGVCPNTHKPTDSDIPGGPVVKNLPSCVTNNCKYCTTTNTIPGNYTDNAISADKSCLDSGCPCITRLGDACINDNKDQNCSSFCDASNFMLPPNQSLRCVNASFWGAADDFVGGGLFDAEKILGEIIKIALYILIGVVGMVIIIWLIKFIFNRITAKKEK